MSTNQDRLGVSVDDLNQHINPSKSAYGYWVGPAVDGAGGTGSGTVWTDNDSSWSVDQWNDFYLVVDSSPANHLITDTKATGTAIVSDDTLTGLSGAYEIRSREFIATTDAMAVVERVAGEIKSRLPEKYRRMIYRVEGEVVVNQAYRNQPTALTHFTINNVNNLRLWRNYEGTYLNRDVNRKMYSPQDVTQGAVSTSDYTVSTANSITTITWSIGSAANQLNMGDTVVGDYDHDLPTVPKSLEFMALNMAAYDLLRINGVGEDEINPHVAANRERAVELLDNIHEGKAGIDEFDKIRLYEETRTGGREGGRVVSVTVDRA